MGQPLAETLRRLREHLGDQGLNSRELAGETALPEEVVTALLRGEEPPADEIEDRVRARIKTVRDDYLARTQKKPGDLVSEVHQDLGITREWARRLLSGQKMPNVPLLVGLAKFFKVEGGQEFFTDAPADALNRVLQRRLDKFEKPSTNPVEALLAEYGVVATDMRHHGLTLEQLETVLAGVIKSVVPPKGDTPR